MTDGKSPWRNLIRFQDETGKEHFGDVSTVNVEQLLESDVPTLLGKSLRELERTGETCKVKKVSDITETRHLD